ncbi:uncharacterized protein LOC109810351 [Cajanus cajan]|uniref:uncharacterized protein LOC109810351 n=1 Tax=Cajanus cajan TaxID=3821 RepID=UPI00098DA989|nr:uncharacterized protein LOC109810351 [Cajanus cajan]
MSSNPIPSQSQTSSNSVKRTDIGWKHCHPTKKNDTNENVCNYCKKIMKGGITRAKQHLMGKKGNVAPCQSVPQEVKDELWTLEKNKKMKESESCQRVMEDVTLGSEDYTLEGDLGELEVETLGANERKKVAMKKGPIDLFCKRPETAIAKNKKEKLKQISIRESCDKEATARVHQYIARFWYQAGLSFNMIKLESFHDMVAAIGSFGPHLRPPSYHEIRVPLLQKEMEYTEKLMKIQKGHWASFGGNDPLTCNQVYDVSGVGEPLMYTTRNKRKQPPSAEGASSQKVSKKGKGVSSLTRKGKGKVAEVVEEDLEDISEELEEELPNINFDNSEGEEVEGYAPLAFNEENDYIEEEEENDDDEEEDD